MNIAALFAKKQGFLMIEIALCVVLLLLIIRPFMNITRNIVQQSYKAKISLASAHETRATEKKPVRFVCTATKRLPQKSLESVAVYV